MYIRKVCYLDYLENNARVGNAGHIKLCLHDERLALEVRIRGLSRSMEGQAAVRLVMSEAEGRDMGLLRSAEKDMEESATGADEGMLGVVEICGGSGCFRGEFDAENVDGKRNEFLRFKGIEILLPGGGMLRTDFGYEEKKRVLGDESREMKAAVSEKQSQNIPQKSAVIKQEVQNGSVSEWIPETLDERLSVDKWEQLCRTHRQLHPFGNTPYISLTPRDFVILRKEYQQLVNNSFLLHGFYNYRHLILGKEGAEEGGIYYLGVPGTYYDREKTVAVMFGFEGFEASGTVQRQPEEPEGTTASGTFGYYMKRVEI